jgi:hypothetical protein
VRIDARTDAAYGYYMNTKTEIRYTTSRKGQRRAWYWSSQMFRWFPMPLAEAEMLVMTGAAKDITAAHAAGRAF